MTGDEHFQTISTLLSQNKPGEVLALLREQQGVGIADIASETLIPEGKLADLEADDYSNLGSEAFVMGYIRKVGSLLGADADALIGAYHRARSAAGDEVVDGGPHTMAPQLAPRVPGPLQTVFTRFKAIPMRVAVVVLLLVWVAGVALLKQGDALEGQAPLVLETAIEAPTETVAPEVQESVSAIETLEDGTPKQIEPPEEIESSKQIQSEVTAPAAEANHTSLERSISAADVQHQLTMTFTDECWVKITDASGKVIFAQLQTTGDNLQLFGEAPFDVMLGNARAADILINGNPVAVVPVPGRKTLRLTVQP